MVELVFGKAEKDYHGKEPSQVRQKLSLEVFYHLQVHGNVKDGGGKNYQKVIVKG